MMPSEGYAFKEDRLPDLKNKAEDEEQGCKKTPGLMTPGLFC